MPQFAARLDRSRIGEGRRPVLRRIVGESIRREKFPAISGREVQFKNAVTARETVGLVEAKADRVDARSDRAAGERESHHERRETSADAPETLARLGDGD